jgi:hypothetical protein
MESDLDYTRLLAAADPGSLEATISILLDELPNQWKRAYLGMTPHETNLCVVTHKTFRYIYDDYGTLEVSGKVPYNPVFEARLVAALGRSTPQRSHRDDGRLKGWVGPTEVHFGRQSDKGHFIAHSIGGAVDQCELNVFVQRRDLNRGWSVAGKRFRSMEKYCSSNPGTFCFSRPIYSFADGSSKPVAVEFGVLKADGELWVEVFDNQ